MIISLELGRAVTRSFGGSSTLIEKEDVNKKEFIK